MRRLLLILAICCAVAFAPAPSRKTLRILYSCDRSGNYEIKLVDADGKNDRNLTNNDAKDTSPEQAGSAGRSEAGIKTNSRMWGADELWNPEKRYLPPRSGASVLGTWRTLGRVAAPRTRVPALFAVVERPC